MTQQSRLRLDSPVQYLKGIGPKRAQYFARLGIATVRDLLFCVPHRYVDYTTVRTIKEVAPGTEATIIGRVRAVGYRKTRNYMPCLSVLIADSTGTIDATWFNRPDLRHRFHPGDELVVSGKVTLYRGKQLVNPLYEMLGGEDDEATRCGSIIAIYPLTEGLSLWDVRRSVQQAWQNCRHEVGEYLPDGLRARRSLLPLPEALERLHFPRAVAETRDARRRLVYDEFLLFEIVIARRRFRRRDEVGYAQPRTGRITDRYLASLPFTLTRGQEAALEQIACDMASPKPMNRLLQGDVGSGKTVLAMCAMMIAVENSHQAALMAPTEILAEQHFLNQEPLLRAVGIHAALLTSSVKAPERAAIIAGIAAGEVQAVFGTHALIEQGVQFRELGLAIIDEQHRFGVMQRAALVNKGRHPDFLVLSATPIPRTLALTLYGDLDITTMVDKPPGRGEIITQVVREREKDRTYSFVRTVLDAGRQAYIICPIIEKSEKVDLKSVADATREVQSALPGYSVAAIHGRMPTDERVAIMDGFRRGRTQILVATTVIEVGVDIPNATIMIIEHPERFGLAQLHQLRGRIGRGADRSYCFLVLSHYVPAETYERVAFFAHNSDGFALARQDMKLRGPGEILGRRQHGLPDLVLGDVEEDQELLEIARDDAFAIVERDIDLTDEAHRGLRERLEEMTASENLLRIG